MTDSLSILKMTCSEYIDSNSSWLAQWAAHNNIYDALNVSAEELGKWLENHYITRKWYQRLWQRLAQPISRLENLYVAKRILEIDQSQPIPTLIAKLTKLQVQLNWFSKLRSRINSTKLLLLLTEKFNSNKPKFSPPETVFLLTTSQRLACEKLDINPNEPITLSLINAAYRKAALRWHPDKNPANLQEATALFQKLNEAYSLLKNLDLQLIGEPASSEFWGDILFRIVKLEEAMQRAYEADRQYFQQQTLIKKKAIAIQTQEIKNNLGVQISELKKEMETQRIDLKNYHRKIEDNLEKQMSQLKEEFKKERETQKAEIEILKQNMQTILKRLVNLKKPIDPEVPEIFDEKFEENQIIGFSQ